MPGFKDYMYPPWQPIIQGIFSFHYYTDGKRKKERKREREREREEKKRKKGRKEETKRETNSFYISLEAIHFSLQHSSLYSFPLT